MQANSHGFYWSVAGCICVLASFAHTDDRIAPDPRTETSTWKAGSTGDNRGAG